MKTATACSLLVPLLAVVGESHAAMGDRTVTVRTLDLYPHGAPEETKREYAASVKRNQEWLAQHYPDYPADVPDRLKDRFAKVEAWAEERASQKFVKDGKVDTWEVYSASGELLERRVDNQPWHAPDGKVDETEFYCQGNLILRFKRLSGGKMFMPHATLELFDGGALVEEQHDIDMDGVFDNRLYFPSGTRDDYVCESDDNRDGTLDHWQVIIDDKVVRTEQDKNGDGRVDCIVVQPQGLGHDSQEYLDNDHDGRFDEVKIRRYDARSTKPAETTIRPVSKDERAPVPFFPGQPGNALRLCGLRDDREEDVEPPQISAAANDSDVQRSRPAEAPARSAWLFLALGVIAGTAMGGVSTWLMVRRKWSQ